MKILVCTDGSKQSVKAIKEAAKIAEGCNVDEVAILHVYENRASLPYWGEGTRDDKRLGTIQGIDRTGKRKAEKNVV